MNANLSQRAQVFSSVGKLYDSRVTLHNSSCMPSIKLFFKDWIYSFVSSSEFQKNEKRLKGGIPEIESSSCIIMLSNKSAATKIHSDRSLSDAA